MVTIVIPSLEVVFTTSQGRTPDVPSPLKRPALLFQMRLQSQPNEIAISFQQAWELLATSPHAPMKKIGTAFL